MNKTLLSLLFIVFAISLFAQTEFDIRAFSDSTKYGWKNWLDRSDYRVKILDRQQLLQLYEIEANSIQGNILKSALIPGLGQITSKAGTKGSVILGGELLALGASLYFYDRSNFYYQKYLDATQVEDIETYYSAAQSPRQYSMLFLALGVIIWGYNIFDVIQTTDDYNAKVWQEIVEKYGKKTVTFGPDGLSVKF